MIDWTIFLSVITALVAYTFIRSVVRWFHRRRQARANRYTELVDWWVNQRTATLVADGVGESEANEQAGHDLSRLRFQIRLFKLFENVWEIASVIFALVLLFSLFTYAMTRDFDEVAHFLGRVVSESGLKFVLLIVVWASVITVFEWRHAVVTNLERQKDPTWTDSPKLVKRWTKAQRDFWKRYDRATGLYRHALTAAIIVIGFAYVVLACTVIILAAWYFGFFPPSS